MTPAFPGGRVAFPRKGTSPEKPKIKSVLTA